MNKKIYITSLHLKHGGIEMAITLLANALVKRGYEVEILNTYHLDEPAYELDSRVTITYLTNVYPNRQEIKEAFKKRKILAMIKEGIYAIKVLYLKKKTMKEKIKSIREGTIIATRNDHAVLLSRYGNEGVKKIAQLHHDHQFEKRILKDFRKKYFNIDIFVVLTELLKKEIEEIMLNNHHTKVMVIPNFLPLNEKNIEKKREKQIVAVGRLNEVKGFLRLLEIWKNVSADEPIILKIIGDGEQRESIQNKIGELQLENKVILTGAMGHDKVLEEMEKSLVYAMTSYTEAFPYVLLEAMNAGLPIVAYDVRVGPRAIVSDGKDGYLIQDNNESEYVQKMKNLISDNELWGRMSANARKTVQKFSENEVIKLWMDIL
ncbi:glycosyltransferase [Faecalimonas sp.]